MNEIHLHFFRSSLENVVYTNLRYEKKNYLNILELVFVLFTGHCIVYANIIINFIL